MRFTGWVIVGGLTLGTLLTLFVIPAIYLLLVRKVPVQDYALTTKQVVFVDGSDVMLPRHPFPY